MSEKWITIPGFEDYEASDQGNIRSLISNKQLKPVKTKHGYLQVVVSKKSKKVHRLILTAFLGWNHLDCDHINGIKTDNRLCNLRYCSRRDNVSFHYAKLVNKSSKYTGVCWRKDISKWMASIKVNNKSKALGVFECEEDANNAYVEYKKLLPDTGLGVRL